MSVGRIPITMSPQNTEKQEQRSGLFSGKIHFRVPSAEGTFAFGHAEAQPPSQSEEKKRPGK